jgi:hypothetical protein
MNHGGIECQSASNSLEDALEKQKKAIIRGTPISGIGVCAFGWDDLNAAVFLVESESV